MRVSSLRSLCVVVLVAGFGSVSAGQELIPRAELFRPVTHRTVRLGPRGDWVTFVAPTADGPRCWRLPLGIGPAVPLLSVPPAAADDAVWALDGRHLLFTADLVDAGRRRLFRTDVAEDIRVALTPPDVDVELLALGIRRPDAVLARITSADGGVSYERVALDTGRRTAIGPLPPGTLAVHPDADLNVDLISLPGSDGGRRLAVREGDGWVELVRWSAEEAERSRVVGPDVTGRSVLLIDAREGDVTGLYRFGPPRTRTRGRETELVYEAVDTGGNGDISEVLRHPRSGRAQAVARDGVEREWRLIDRTIGVDLNQLVSTIGPNFRVVDRDRGDRRWLLERERADGPTTYAVYDRENRSVLKLFSARPRLDGRTFGVTEAVAVPARDGLKLPALLTRPRVPAGRPGPLIVLAAGDPWTPVRFGFDPVAAWLADRGYAVLRVNVRGTEGFGRDFVARGRREWAAGRHDDLIDAANWAVEEGVADPNRIGLLGASHGGYAALVGASFTPDYFACAVSISGPSRVEPLITSFPSDSAARRRFDTQVGRAREATYLDQISPLTRAASVRRPLLLAHGTNDQRAPVEDALAFARAAGEAGAPVTTLWIPGAGHRLSDGNQIRSMLAVAESFLATHLGGRSEDTMADAAEAARAAGLTVQSFP